ncbi:MAG TPA: CHAT domain-containing protein [Gemmatimonadaceae bacterium]|nr:CHAT domain-containing protein [Gemmatimonadaceae bacterium]
MRRVACSLLHVAVATAALVTSGGAQTVADVRAIQREARHASDVDSADALAKRWASDSSTRLTMLGLADLAWLTAHYDVANRRYVSLAPHKGQRPDAISIYAQLGLARVLLSKGEPGPADTAYASAAALARAARDSVPLVEAIIGWSLMRSHSRSPAAAAALIAGANRLIPHGEDGLMGEYYCTRVGVGALPRGANPIAMLRTGVALSRKAGDRHVEAHCWFELGNALVESGDMVGGIAAYDTLEHQVIYATDLQALARIRQRRAYAEEQYGDYNSALKSARLAVMYGEETHALPVVAYARLTEGTVYLGLGDISSAITATDSADHVFAQVGDVIGRINAMSTAGRVALAGDDTAAARRADTSEYRLASSIGSSSYKSDAEAALASLAMYQKQWADASRWLDSVDADLARGGLHGWTEQQLFNRGVLALAAGRWVEAEQRLAQVAHGLDSAQHRDRYVAASRLAEIHLALGDTTRAEHELVAAEDVLDRWRATLDDREIRVLAFQVNSQAGRPDAGVAKVIAAVARTGRIGNAFELAERRRARDLEDRLATSDASTPWSTSTNILETVQHALPNDTTALLEYVTGPEDAPTTLFVITRHTQRAYLLPPSDSVTDDVARLVAFVENGVNTNAASTALGTVLLGPALADLPASVTRLVVVPDGALHRIPFEALRVNGQYVVRRYAVALAPSAAVQSWLWAHDTPAAHGAPVTVLALGDPRFAGEARGDAETAAFRSAFDETGGLPRLKASADEAQLVARFGATGVVRLRDSASAWFLKHAPLDSFRVIHLATHAVVDDRAATRTALALAPGSGENGFVTPKDLAALKLRADLVVLSACRTAGGRIVAGEGVRGLTAPLIAAGARAVVATYWEIGDRQTVRLVHDFYRAMADGHPAADALRLAEVAAMERGAPPREWAAFTISGDPMVRVPMTVPRFDWWWRLFH